MISRVIVISRRIMVSCRSLRWWQGRVSRGRFTIFVRSIRARLTVQRWKLSVVLFSSNWQRPLSSRRSKRFPSLPSVRILVIPFTRVSIRTAATIRENVKIIPLPQSTQQKMETHPYFLRLLAFGADSSLRISYPYTFMSSCVLFDCCSSSL